MASQWPKNGRTDTTDRITFPVYTVCKNGNFNVG